MKNYTNKPIFIVGAERSGCGIIVSLLQRHGVWTGSLTGTGENKRLRWLMGAYYNFLGMDEKRQYPLPDVSNIYLDAKWAEKCIESLQIEGYKEGVWLYKSAAILQTYPLWVKAFPEARFIVVLRDKKEVVNSCLKTGHMIAFSDKQKREAVKAQTEEDAWSWWYEYHMELINQLSHSVSPQNIMYIYPAALGDSHLPASALLDWLDCGMSLDMDAYHYVKRLIK